MTKLVVFCFAVIGLIAVVNLDSFSNLPVNNARFDMDKAIAKHEAHQKELAELAKMREERENPPKVVEEEVVEGPLVVLDTPQLVSGDKLYGKCIVCHGKRGEGKKSQNAPKIGGQMAWYIEKQIVDMQNKVRINKVMDPYIKKLSAQDVKDLSAYIEKLPWKEK
ncbi:c-type cytochrome [Halobacteriovorax sp. GB3]|uniref:c-type cytochrome n=1 Tax=Halobacteriovorax sp. GB3 TaxID=2719615 RepID=UPI002362C96F|nr:c-type cytochrome [Halobacteriovorax sp. GB3]MDD0854307.1 c-type cytochrome [Halobacteriovorax sp. GB3]